MMDKTEALKIVEQAINASILKGVYNLSDADKIIQAIKELSKAVAPIVNA
jgi:hypothetical protein